MRGRACLLGFIAGTAAVHTLADLPAPTPLRLLGAATLVAALVLLPWWRPRPWAGILVPALIATLAGAWLTAERARARLDDALQAINLDRVAHVELRVDSLVRESAAGLRFEARTLAAHPSGVPRHISVFWPVPGWRSPYAPEAGVAAGLPALRPGQVWRMALLLRPPQGLENPGGTNMADWAFARNLRANGRVRGEPQYLREAHAQGLMLRVTRVRDAVRRALAPVLAHRAHGGLLLALAIGDQSGIDRATWDVFNRTGIVHLVSISGTHVSLVAGMGAALASVLWRRLSWRHRRAAEWVPAHSVAALTALVLALVYSLLAGWGIPAQRSFLMLATLAVAHLLRWRPGPSRLLVLAAFVVVLMDPWALLSRGFWLSFGAIVILLLLAAASGAPACRARAAWPRRALGRLLAGLRLQLAVSLALFPGLALLFHEIPLLSPLVNLVAIPLVGLVATPAALLAALLATMPATAGLAALPAMVGEAVMQGVIDMCHWLLRFDLASPAVATPPVAISALAALGVLAGLMPKGWPLRAVGWCLMLPALLWRAPALAPGDWEAWALDVGQGGAIVLRTARHALLFDAGARSSPNRDAGRDVIAPALRSLGIRRLDLLVVSHADMDHVGGVRSVLAAVPVTQAYASFDLGQWLARESRRLPAPVDALRLPLATLPCGRGQRWEMDGVVLEFLWPDAPSLVPLDAGSRARNAASCVLSVRGRHHGLLLPGDISAAQEARLLASGVPPHDALVAAHHGSRTASSAAFLQAVQARHVIAQSGRWNRHGHPHAESRARWRRFGMTLWRNDLQGAVRLRSRAGVLHADALRAQRQRYWQSRVWQDRVAP